MRKDSNGIQLINNNKKFSILVLNYNNFNYLFEMLDSIYNQSYSNIELVIADDASSYFDKERVIKYINNKERKIKTTIFVNDENIGTVKTINKYLKELTGDYYLITASDDVFANDEVLANFVRCFEKHNTQIITSQWIICDNNLNKIRNFIPNKKIIDYNNDQEKLLLDMCKSNRFGSGATAYKKELFNTYKFDETYIFLEDWPLWLKLLFNEKIIYVDSFDSLLHRSGGISETTTISDSKKQFFKELLETFHREIIPNLKNFTNYKKWSILESYKFYIEYYGKYIDTSFYDKELKKIVYNNRPIKFYYYLNEINPHLIRNLKEMIKHRHIVLITFILTIIISMILINFIGSKNLILLFIIMIYIIIYIGFVFLKEVRRRVKWKNIP
ncbi:MAG: glycosyltransferase family 2 protein [Bacilli bacterium]|nr:glycosyltransferase family 2 protein [Bacilli bacterium]